MEVFCKLLQSQRQKHNHMFLLKKHDLHYNISLFNSKELKQYHQVHPLLLLFAPKTHLLNATYKPLLFHYLKTLYMLNLFLLL